MKSNLINKKKTYRRNPTIKVVGLVILAFCIFAVLVITHIFLKYSKTDVRISEKTVNQTSFLPLKRSNIDIQKILSERFITYENQIAGLKLQYPAVMEIYIYDSNKANQLFSRNNLYEAVSFSLIAQPPGAYEIYDGLNIDVLIRDNSKNESLDQIIKPLIVEKLDYEDGNKYKGEIEINGIVAKKIYQCCYAGGTEMYFISSLDNKYIIEIHVFSVGQDEKNFDKVAESILKSIQFVN